MKTTLTEFQRNFRKAREAADRGDPVIVKGESGEYVFERRSAPTEHPFVGLEGVSRRTPVSSSRRLLMTKGPYSQPARAAAGPRTSYARFP